MIKAAVTRPNIRRAAIEKFRDQLNWPNDPYFKGFGIRVNPKFAQVKARLLPPPKIQFGPQSNGMVEPGFSGRWDLRGKKFLLPNTLELASWGFLILEDSCQEGAALQFAQSFANIYRGHGGNVTGKPVIVSSQRRNPNVAEALDIAFMEIAKQNKRGTQLIFIVLRSKGIGSYERIKKNADCRWGVLTQCVLGKHVVANQNQYHSNVCMKVNAKLGGTTSRIPGPNPNQPVSPFFRVPTMMIGVDVSHASPGSLVASVASMTMSMDPNAARYAATAETNGFRVEVLSQANIRGFFDILLPIWMSNIKQPPQHLYYFRDGVSEGQFAHVLEFEVKGMKAALTAWYKRQYPERVVNLPKFTVIIATKRHHIRFFPPSNTGDRNGNPKPGTLVEREVTHPFHWDFYLCSHVAIQGTARPVHYHVILDEANCVPDNLQKMIYEQCYQYARSTTPVSLHPAVYYAHLASNRARCHEDIPSSLGPRTGSKGHASVRDKLAQDMRIEDKPQPIPLLGLGCGDQANPAQRDFITRTMWYI
jgi:eukaryotic translation initiation factor 2C